MRFIWIQQWTAMPVIMENQEGTGGASGGQLPGVQGPGDPSTLHEISERDIHQKSCKPYAKPLPSILLPVCSGLLTTLQQMRSARTLVLSRILKDQLSTHKAPVAGHSIFKITMEEQTPPEMRLQAPSTCRNLEEHCQSLNYRAPGCHLMIPNYCFLAHQDSGLIRFPSSPVKQ